MVEKNKQLKINHEMITVLREENCKLEAKVKSLEFENGKILMTRSSHQALDIDPLLCKIQSLEKKLE